MIIFVFAQVFVQVNAVACTMPKNSMSIRDDLLICDGIHDLPDGLILDESNVTVDCNGATIRGDYGGVAFKLKNKRGVIVKNCVIERFDYAYYFDGVNGYQLKNNSLEDILHEAHIQEGLEENDEGAFEKTDETPLSIPLLPPPQPTKTQEQEELRIVAQEPLQEILESLAIQKKNVIEIPITKTYKEGEDQLFVNVDIPDLEGTYTLYEVIPKELAETADEIFLKDGFFFTARTDPVKVWLEVELTKGLHYQYAIFGKKKGQTHTIITAEKPEEVVKRFPELQQHHSALIRNFFIILLFLVFVIVYHYEKKVHS